MNSKKKLPIYYTNVKVKVYLASTGSVLYDFRMFMTDYFIVFPEGDTQEIRGRLSLNTLVDVNGNPVELPLRTNRIVVFRVEKVTTKDYKGGSETYHFLEQLSARELLEYVEA